MTKAKFLLVIGLIILIVSNCVSKTGKNLLNAIDDGDLVLANQLIKRISGSKLQGKVGTVALIHAAYYGHISIVKVLVSKGVNPTEGLIRATARNHIKIVKYLLAKGANVNVADKNRRTPLMYAINDQNMDMMILLLASGSEVNSVDQQGFTPLFHAVKKINYNMVRMLLEKGASKSINSRTRNGYTALYQLLLQSNPNNRKFESKYPEFFKVVELMIKHGADITLSFDVDNASTMGYYFMSGETSHLDLAANNKRLLSLFLSTDIDINNEMGRRALFRVIKNSYSLYLTHVDSLDSIKQLIQAGLDINKKDKQGQTALFVAVQDGNNRIVEQLLLMGADPSVQDQSQQSALDYAIQKGYSDIQTLLETRGKKNPAKAPNYEALIESATYSDLSEMKRLIKAGININARNHINETALSMLLRKGDGSEKFIEVVKLLVENGANLNMRHGITNQSLVGIAIRGNHHGIIPFLIKKGLSAEGLDSVVELSMRFNFDTAKLLIDNGALVPTQERYFSPLYFAVKQPTTDIKFVEHLINKGVSINKQMWDESSLHIAVRQHNMKVVKLLLRHGADIDAPGYYMRTPLMYAAMNNDIDIANYLVHEGANVMLKDREGLTALDHAKKQTKKDQKLRNSIIQMLESKL